MSIDDDKVCAATPSVNLVPYASEYEGYMGNDGNTIYRWYRRPALRAGGALDPRVRLGSGLDALAWHGATRLTARLARPARAANDWSVTSPGGGGCELCATLATFLHDPARKSFDWPLAEPGRRHVHHTLDVAELPVRHATRRQGRPYTLALTNTDALFDRERQQREWDTADLAWLEANYPMGPRTKGTTRHPKDQA